MTKNRIRKISDETIETAKNIAQEICKTCGIGYLAQAYIHNWYRSTRNTLSYEMRICVLAVLKASNVIISCYYPKPTTEDVRKEIPDISYQLKHHLPIFLIVDDRTEYDMYFMWRVRIF